MTDQPPTPAPAAQAPPDPGPGPRWITTDSAGKATGTVYHTDLDCRGLATRRDGSQVVTVGEAVLNLMGFKECGTCERTKTLRGDPQLTALAKAMAESGLVKTSSKTELADALAQANKLRSHMKSNGLEFKS